MTNEYLIDAKNKAIGRVASEAASILMGKNIPNFARNIIPKVKVTIENASKARVTQEKFTQKKYFKFSGYPGGRRGESMEKLISKKGFRELFLKAIYGMLPKNRLRKPMLKNLVVTE